MPDASLIKIPTYYEHFIQGSGIVVLDMPLLNTNTDRNLTGVLISGIVLQLLSCVAEGERQFIRQRQVECISAGPRRKKYGSAADPKKDQLDLRNCNGFVKRTEYLREPPQEPCKSIT